MTADRKGPAFAFLTITACLLARAGGLDGATASSLRFERVAALARGSHLEVSIADEKGRALPARISLRKKGEPLEAGLDPVGRRLDREGCFYVEGNFRLSAEPATYELWVRSGFSRVPYAGEVVLAEGNAYHAAVTLNTWFSLEERGWYAADFHLHSFHPPITPKDINALNGAGKTDYDFMALACRAAGLNLAVDNLHHLNAPSRRECEVIEQRVRRPGFILQVSSEVRIDWQGHVNVPGTAPGIYARTKVEHPLPLLQILNQTHREGGLMVYTHPLRIPWFYWMSAVEMPAHIVLEDHGEFLDIARPERKPSIIALFGLWNLGIRIAAAGTTDNQFNRGIDDRARTYLKPARFTLHSLLQAGRDRASVASSGDIFACIEIDGQGPGSIVVPGAYRLAVEAHSLAGVAAIEVISDGKILRRIEGAGALHLREEMTVSLDAGGYVSILARDRKGGYSVPTAIFAGEVPRHDKFHTVFYATEANRAKKTTNDYFLHLACAVNSHERIKAVLLKKDGLVVQEIRTDLTTPRSRFPSSSFNPDADHEKCWLFWPSPEAAQYFVLSYPIDGDGEYQAVIETQSGKTLDAGKIIYKDQAPCWQGGIVHLWGTRGDFYLETSAHRPRTATSTDAFRGDWISAYKVRARGGRGDDMQASASGKGYNSLSTLVAPAD